MEKEIMETLRRRKTEENVYSMNNFGILIKKNRKKENIIRVSRILN